MTEPQYLLDKPPQVRFHRSEGELLRYLRQACRQISEFRREYDPHENTVLVTPVEMMGAQAFADGTEEMTTEIRDFQPMSWQMASAVVHDVAKSEAWSSAVPERPEVISVSWAIVAALVDEIESLRTDLDRLRAHGGKIR